MRLSVRFGSGEFSGSEPSELTARFEGCDLVYGFGEFDTLVPAYAATVHKS